ncbi:MAG: nitrite reductase [Nocardioides sp.]|uniref:nitrite reductase n=1 Tax=Nocardioides sp. TaxID=35761 RepID=UPI0039E4C896
MSVTRTRVDRCPGVLRPWPAGDGLLVRVRLIGGRIRSSQLAALVAFAEEYGDGRVRLTGRANLQVRGLPGADGRLAPAVLGALAATGLLPSTSHDLVRNVMVSPQTGLAGGRADLRPVADELDRLLCASERLAALPGKFLFVLDDGRGDLVDHSCDLGLVALDGEGAQLRVGARWGEVVDLTAAPAALLTLADEFLDRRGSGPDAAWHVEELTADLRRAAPADPRLPEVSGPLPFGRVPGGTHVAVPDSGLDRAAVERLTSGAGELVVTPWRGVLVPGGER